MIIFLLKINQKIKLYFNIFSYQIQKSRQPGYHSTCSALDPLLCVLPFRIVCPYHAFARLLFFFKVLLLSIFPKIDNFRHLKGLFYYLFNPITPLLELAIILSLVFQFKIALLYKVCDRGGSFATL